MVNEKEIPPPPFVSVEWLADHLDDDDVRVIDVRGRVLPAGSPEPRYLAKRADYEAGHVPRALFVDWTRDIVDPDDAVTAQLAREAKFGELLHRLGIGPQTLVVAYDDYAHMFAGRFVWALRVYGHERARVLDGGFSRWTAEGRPISRAVEQVPEGEALGDPLAPKVRSPLYVVADGVEPMLARGGLLIDARAPDQFAGKISAAARAGHIPGAKNVPYSLLIDPETKKFRAKGQIAEVFRSAGIDVANLPREIVCYCNGGVTATVPLMALSLFGRDDVAVFDGSWNEWGNDPSRPIER